MTEPIITYRGVIYPWHCDHIGHMNVMWYIGKFDEATWHFLAEVGITPTYMREEKRGMAAVRQEIRYRRELHAGDIITVRSGLLEVTDKAMRFFHEMRNDETAEIAAAVISTGVHIDGVTRTACPFPPEIKARGEKMIVPYEL